MAWIDLIDAFFELGTKKAKERASVVVALGVLLVPSITIPAIMWVIHERAEGLTEELSNLFIPSPSPSAELGAGRQHRSNRERPAQHGIGHAKPVDSRSETGPK